MSKKRKNNRKSNNDNRVVKEPENNQLKPEAEAGDGQEDKLAIDHLNVEAKEQVKEEKKEENKENNKDNNKENDAEQGKEQGKEEKTKVLEIILEHLKEVRNHFFHNYSGFERKLITAIIVLVVVAAVSVYLVISRGLTIEGRDRVIDTLSGQLSESQLQNANMQTQIDELNNQIQILSESFNSKAEEVQSLSQSETDSRFPSAYPLKGTAAIYAADEANPNEDDEAEEVDEMDDAYGHVEYENDEDIPSVLFVTGADTRVVASGLGRVISIQEDASFGICVSIDHENGYKSIYRGYGIALVSEGDTVSQGCDIIRIIDENTMFQYRVTFDDEYIDPMTCMEING